MCQKTLLRSGSYESHPRRRLIRTASAWPAWRARRLQFPRPGFPQLAETVVQQPVADIRTDVKRRGGCSDLFKKLPGGAPMCYPAAYDYIRRISLHCSMPLGDINPLYFFGGTQTGKTHLLHAIERYLNDHNHDLRIVRVRTEEFVNDILDAIRTGRNMTDLRDKYRNVDVLLMDDIQFLVLIWNRVLWSLLIHSMLYMKPADRLWLPVMHL